MFLVFAHGLMVMTIKWMMGMRWILVKHLRPSCNTHYSYNAEIRPTLVVHAQRNNMARCSSSQCLLFCVILCSGTLWSSFAGGMLYFLGV